jgi:hypothetical protein
VVDSLLRRPDADTRRRARSLRSKSGGAGDADDGTGLLGRGDQWSLFINLPVLEAATAGLSNCNLLGGGGFGPVYKASSNCSSPPLPLSCALRLTSEHLVVQASRACWRAGRRSP